jgi:hypothetical protein
MNERSKIARTLWVFEAIVMRAVYQKENNKGRIGQGKMDSS